MARIQGNIPVYNEVNISLAANAEYALNRTFDAINIIDLSGSVEMQINDGTPSTCRAGIGFRMPQGDNDVYRATFRETGGSTATLTIATAKGEIQDNRASFAGNQSVQNAAAPNDSLQVDLLAADPGLVALLTGIVANQNSDEDKRKGLTTLEGASYHQQFNDGGTPTTIVSTAANTAGIIIRFANISLFDNTTCYLGLDGTPNEAIIGNGTSSHGTSRGAAFQCRDIFVPAGRGLIASAPSNDTVVNVWYEVL